MYGWLQLRARGATLIELVATITITAIALVTLIALTSTSTQRSADPMIREQALAVAQAYLEEITRKGFCDPDVAADCVAACTGAGACGNAACTVSEGGSRGQYDDVCDYNNLPDNRVRDQTGTLISPLVQYNVSVQVIDDNAAVLNGLTGNAGQVLRIDVDVSHPALQDTVQLSGFRTNF
jgi:MSHA pilin protein MshD